MTAPTVPEAMLVPPVGLSRNAEHEYFWRASAQSEPLGPLPSVTRIIGTIDKSGPLMGWAKKAVAEAAVREIDGLVRMIALSGPEPTAKWLATIPGHQRDAAANLGSTIHFLAEQIVRGKTPLMTPEQLVYVEAYRRDFLNVFRPRFLGAEEMVVSLRHGYAGTADMWVEIDGEKWCLDLKSGAGIYSETALQLAGYSGADFIGRPGTARKFAIPRATRFGVVHVRPEAARLVEYHPDAETFKTFLHALGVYRWQEGQAKTVVGKAIEREGAAA